MFYNWLIKKYLDKDSLIGDLAKDAKRDITFPKTDDLERILFHLQRVQACEGAIAAFKRAYKLYKKEANKGIIENTIERRFKNEIKKHGGKAFKFISPGTAGMPDRIVLLPGGRAVFVELKAPRKELRPLQEKRAEELRALGFQAYKIASIQEVENFITEVCK